MKTRLTTTLALLREHGACFDGYRKLKKSLGAKWSDTKPINLLVILKSNGVQDMLWCLRATKQNNDKVSRLMAADFAESVLHHFTAKYPNDDRPAKAIQSARDFANGKIKRAESAAWGASAESAAARAAARAARAAARAAWAAGDAGAAARAAWAAGDARAAWAAWAAGDAAGDAGAAAGDAGDARAAETKKQAEIIRKWLK
jgi:hypothetical protein